MDNPNYYAIIPANGQIADTRRKNFSKENNTALQFVWELPKKIGTKPNKESTVCLASLPAAVISLPGI